MSSIAEYKRFNISFNDDTLDKISSLGRNRSGVIRQAVDVNWDHRFIVFRVECGINERQFIGVETVRSFYRRNYLIELAKGCNAIRIDIDQLGTGEFKLSSIGVFSTKDNALKYKDFVLNSLMDQGITTYNDEVYGGSTPRFLTILLPIGMAQKLIRSCKAKNMSVDEWFHKLLKKLYKK